MLPSFHALPTPGADRSLESNPPTHVANNHIPRRHGRPCTCPMPTSHFGAADAACDEFNGAHVAPAERRQHAGGLEPWPDQVRSKSLQFAVSLTLSDAGKAS